MKSGAPGGCPTSSLKAVVMNSPQSQKLAVGSMVSRYVMEAIAHTTQPVILLIFLKFINVVINIYFRPAKVPDFFEKYKNTSERAKEKTSKRMNERTENPDSARLDPVSGDARQRCRLRDLLQQKIHFFCKLKKTPYICRGIYNQTSMCKTSVNKLWWWQLTIFRL
jgi:hypothetical protein